MVASVILSGRESNSILNDVASSISICNKAGRLEQFEKRALMSVMFLDTELLKKTDSESGIRKAGLFKKYVPLDKEKER